MSFPLVTRFGADPIKDLELANKRYVDNAGGGVDIGCKVTKSADQSIANTTFDKITWDQESYDTDGFHDNSVDNDELVIPAGLGGKYLVIYAGKWATLNNGTAVIFRIKVNDTEVARAKVPIITFCAQFVGFVGEFVPTDIIQVDAWQDTGVARDFNKDGTTLVIQKIDKAG